MCDRGGIGGKPFQGGRRGNVECVFGINIEGYSTYSAVAVSRACFDESTGMRVVASELSFQGVDEWSVHCILN